jgi:hypothetical protein
MIIYTIYIGVNLQPACVLATTYNKEGAFQVVGLAVAQKVTDHDNREYKQYDHEDLEIEIHVFAESPSHYNDERSVEQGSLD